MTGLTKTRRTTLGHVCVVRYQRVDSVGNGTFRTLYSGGGGVCLQEVIPFAHSVLEVRTACELRGVVPQPVGVAGVLAAGGPSTCHAGLSGAGLVTGRAGFLVMLLGPCCPSLGRARGLLQGRSRLRGLRKVLSAQQRSDQERRPKGGAADGGLLSRRSSSTTSRPAVALCKRLLLEWGLASRRAERTLQLGVLRLLVAEPTRSRNCRA